MEQVAEIEKKELVWQKALQKFVIDKNPTFVSTNGKSINILSLGKHNCFEGPDFVNACLMIDEKLIVGDVELHKKSSSWAYHKHNLNEKYSNVVLHIVFDDDRKYAEANFETIVIDRTSLIEYTNSQVRAAKFNYTSTDYISTAREDFQKYAMFRLMRRSEDVFQLLQEHSITDAFVVCVTKFLNKYFSLRKRPSKIELDITQIVNYFLSSAIFQSILKINSLEHNSSQIFHHLVSHTSLKINQHLKQEIITNVFLPLMYCIANKEKKSEILLWYWSAKTKTKYGVLSREFSLTSQEYIWQQQGMLEFMKEFNNKKFSKESELLINYDIPATVAASVTPVFYS